MTVMAKPTILPQHTRRELQILRELVDPVKPAAFAIAFFRLFESSERNQRLPARFFRSLTGADVVGNVHLKMTLQLFGNVIAHDRSSPFARNRARIAVVFSQSRSSFAICFRPVRVSL